MNKQVGNHDGRDNHKKLLRSFNFVFSNDTAISINFIIFYN